MFFLPRKTKGEKVIICNKMRTTQVALSITLLYQKRII